MNNGSRSISGWLLALSNENLPPRIVVDAPPPPWRITPAHFVRATSCIFAADVPGSSLKVCSWDCANKQKQSPPAIAVGCDCPSTLSHALPRATGPKHAYSPLSNLSPHGAV